MTAIIFDSTRPRKTTSRPFGLGLNGNQPERLSNGVSDADRQWAADNLNADCRDYCLAGESAPADRHPGRGMEPPGGRVRPAPPHEARLGHHPRRLGRAGDEPLHHRPPRGRVLTFPGPRAFRGAEPIHPQREARLMTTTTTPRRTADTPHGTCRLVLTINGQPYAVRPIPVQDPDIVRGFRLRRLDSGKVYDVVLHREGHRSCDCGDFEFRRAGRDPAGCKHARALAVLGLL